MKELTERKTPAISNYKKLTVQCLNEDSTLDHVFYWIANLIPRYQLLRQAPNQLKKFHLKLYVVLFSLFIQSFCFGQNKSLLKTDFNTLYICIDSISYKQLCQSTYLKDTLFLCRENKQETNTDSYNGKYLIGESSTLEFFQPKNTNYTGDHFGDWGIEFKTRNINILDEIIEQSNFLNFPIDTCTNKIILDSLKIPWYKELNFKNSKSELIILEYQQEYLEFLGFTKKQIRQSMSFKDYNNILSNGNNGITTIEYNEVDTLPEFPIQEIRISLLNDQDYREEKISENLLIKINGKIASLIFNYNN